MRESDQSEGFLSLKQSNDQLYQKVNQAFLNSSQRWLLAKERRP